MWLKALVIFGGALWLSLMEVAVLLPLWPGVLYLTRPLIVPPGWTLEVIKVKTTYHRPGEQGLVVMAHGPEGARDVKGKAVFALWGFLFIDALITAAVLVLVFWR